MLGTPLMPWQRLVADVGGELVVSPETGEMIPAYRTVVYSVPRQNGKGLSEDTPVPVPAGWARMGDLEVGDELFDETGARCRVTFVSERRWLDCYRVRFSDGTSVVADGDHLWRVFDVWGYVPGTGRGGAKGAWLTLPTREMAGRADIGTRGKQESRYRLPDVGPLEGCSDLPLDPWLLGAWLGDGDSIGSVLTVGNDDLPHVRCQVARAGAEITTERQDPRTGAWRVRFRRHGETYNTIPATLRTLGVWGDKHIPTPYLRGTVGDRIALLQGLMDTDGTVCVAGSKRTSRRCEFSVTNERLARDTLELVRSLGIRASWRVDPAKINGRYISDRYRIAFNTEHPVFRLPRKAERHAEQGPLRERSRMITSVEPVPTVPTRCIQVDSPNSLFRCGEGMVPTHNTTLTLAWEVTRALTWETPQRVTYTAQTGQDARDKLLNEQVPMLERSDVWPLVSKVARRSGEEAVLFRTGSRLGLQASTEAAGHGTTIGLGVIDEAFHDHDDRREGSLRPAMRTVEDAQLLVMSTMGTQASTYWNRVVETGRAAAEADTGTGIAYFEWSADRDADPTDPAVIAGCNPALGYKITMASLEADMQGMEDAEWRRTGLNITNNQGSTGPISLTAWAEVQDHTAAPTGDLVWGVESSIEGTYASVVAADPEGNVEQVDYRGGTEWLPERVAGLRQAHGGRVVIDSRGPGRRFLQPLRALGVEVDELATPEVAAAALNMVDRVNTGRLRVQPHPALSAAVDAARKRWSGDQWFWDRKGPLADVSPLIAASHALLIAGSASRGEPRLVVL